MQLPDTSHHMDVPVSHLLKTETRTTHERLDEAIMAARPFDNTRNYSRFLRMQFALHRDVLELYKSTELHRAIPFLGELSRYLAIKQDLDDLQVVLPDRQPGQTACVSDDFAEALGWLYVVEGSNLGAAFLFKAAAKLGLSEKFGARHLAPASEGRAAHWRRFKASLDSIPLDKAERERTIHGARAAFSHASALTRLYLFERAT
ncbi:MAG: biliverdin-producing heme oxygenase [Pseudomonadota bacterium]